MPPRLAAAAADGAAASPRGNNRGRSSREQGRCGRGCRNSGCGRTRGQSRSGSCYWSRYCCMGRNHGSAARGRRFRSSVVVDGRCRSTDKTVYKDPYSLRARRTTDAPNGGVVVGQQLLKCLEIFSVLRVGLILQQAVEGILEGTCTLLQQCSWYIVGRAKENEGLNVGNSPRVDEASGARILWPCSTQVMPSAAQIELFKVYTEDQNMITQCAHPKSLRGQSLGQFGCLRKPALHSVFVSRRTPSQEWELCPTTACCDQLGGPDSEDSSDDFTMVVEGLTCTHRISL